MWGCMGERVANDLSFTFQNILYGVSYRKFVECVRNILNIIIRLLFIKRNTEIRMPYTPSSCVTFTFNGIIQRHYN